MTGLDEDDEATGRGGRGDYDEEDGADDDDEDMEDEDEEERMALATKTSASAAPQLVKATGGSGASAGSVGSGGSGKAAKAKPGSRRGCRQTPDGQKLAGPALRRGLQFAEANIQRADMFLTTFVEATSRAGLPKEKNLRELISTLDAKLKQLSDVALGFMEVALFA